MQLDQHEKPYGDDRIYFFERSPDLLSTAGFDGYLKAVSPSWATTLGWSIQELQAKPFVEFVHPEDRAETLQDLDRMIQGKKIDTYRNRFLHKDGSYTRISWHFQMDLEKHLILAVGRVSSPGDDAGSDSAQQLLKQSPLPTFSLDRAGRVTFWNLACERTFGWAQDVILGKVLPIVQSDDEEEFVRTTARMFEDGTDFDRREMTLTHKSGSALRVSFSGAPVKNGSGETTRLIITAVDVTNQKRIEAELIAASTTLQSVIESAPLPTYTLDMHGNVTIWNHACEDVFGWRENEVVGKPLPFVPPSDQLTYLKRMALLATGAFKMSNVEFKRLRKDGTLLDVSISASPLRDPAGRHYGVIAVVADITEKKQMQSRLIQADRMVAMGTLAAGIAHEINNPLSYCIANLMLTREEMAEILPEKMSDKVAGICELLKQAEEGATRVRGIVQDLKMFSRQDEERMEAVDICSVLNAAINMASNEVRPRAQLMREFHGVPLVSGNSGKLTQIFLNLIINAAQAIPEGDAENHRIIVRAETADNGWGVISVTDTGSGIPESIRKRIFDPFFTTKAVGVGTGLGLSICHGIVGSLGGKIEVESEVGRGSTFRVWLPPSQSAKAPDPNRDATSPSALSLSRTQSRVLIIDDEAGLATVLARLLGKEHEVTVATDSSKGLELALNDPTYNLILCDLMMPGLTGMDIHHRLQEIGIGLENKLVFMTGGAFTPSASEFLSRVPNAILQKPFDLQTVRDLVRKRVG